MNPDNLLRSFSMSEPASPSMSALTVRELITIIVMYLDAGISFVITQRQITSFNEIRPLLAEYELYTQTQHPPYIARIDGRTYSISDDTTMMACVEKAGELVLYLNKRDQSFLERIAFINDVFADKSEKAQEPATASTTWRR